MYALSVPGFGKFSAIISLNKFFFVCLFPETSRIWIVFLLTVSHNSCRLSLLLFNFYFFLLCIYNIKRSVSQFTGFFFFFLLKWTHCWSSLLNFFILSYSSHPEFLFGAFFTIYIFVECLVLWVHSFPRFLECVLSLYSLESHWHFLK